MVLVQQAQVALEAKGHGCRGQHRGRPATSFPQGPGQSRGRSHGCRGLSSGYMGHMGQLELEDQMAVRIRKKLSE